MGSPPNFDESSFQDEVDSSLSLKQERGNSVRLQTDRPYTDSPPPSEVFQMLANETRIQILLELYRAERNESTPVPFSALQSAVGSNESARFAYHVRQLVDHFVEKRQEGYTLTSAGHQAANSIIQGTFTNGTERNHAS